GGSSAGPRSESRRSDIREILQLIELMSRPGKRCRFTKRFSLTSILYCDPTQFVVASGFWR
ncbi:MAG: hypothetical protein ACREMY_23025, partial [bacterium]